MQGNKKICLTLCTGAGKSIIARKIVEGALAKNKSVIYLTYRTVLIDQMKHTFKSLDVEYGTLQKYGKTQTKEYDLVIIDEVHWAMGSKLYNNINCKYMIGLSATPITPDGYPLEFDEIIDIVQMKDLIDLGYASPVKVLSTAKVDTKKLKGGKDFTMKGSYELMAKSEILKDIVKVYNDHAKGLKTIIYAVNIEHSEQLKEEFLNAGIICDTVHSKKNTMQLIDDFRENRIKLLINVDILTTGLDLPDIYCLILASPTKSLIKATQIYGRCTRLNPLDTNKEALIIDCCEVIKNTQHPYQRFDFNKIRDKKKSKSCGVCKSDMIIIDKQMSKNDEVTYTVKTIYRCTECSNFEEVEEMKVVNLQFCEKCGEQIESKNLEYKQSDKSIEFTFTCKCGFVSTEREILLSDAELKIIHHEEVMKAPATWKKVAELLKEDCKRNGYKWQYSKRLIDIMQNRNKTPEQVEDMIMSIREKGGKISAIQFME